MGHDSISDAACGQVLAIELLLLRLQTLTDHHHCSQSSDTSVSVNHGFARCTVGREKNLSVQIRQTGDRKMRKAKSRGCLPC